MGDQGRWKFERIRKSDSSRTTTPSSIVETSEIELTSKEYGN